MFTSFSFLGMSCYHVNDSTIFTSCTMCIFHTWLCLQMKASKKI
jgi:hypothetical protein